ncbi:hypothetical protein GCM10028857_20750 [Salinarchaeum chitinilyticum]
MGTGIYTLARERHTVTLDGIDELDRAILYALQRDARGISSGTIAESAGVSASTVRNRIGRLEDRGILRGYHADVDYETVGYQLYTRIVCTAPVPRREELASAAVDVPGVVRVTEVMTGEGNVQVSAVGTDGDDLSRIGRDLDELGLEVVDEDVIRNEYTGAFDGFRTGDVDDGQDGEGADVGQRTDAGQRDEQASGGLSNDGANDARPNDVPTNDGEANDAGTDAENAGGTETN